MSVGLSAYAAAEDIFQSTPQQRLDRLKSMDAAEKEKLLRQKDRFDQLSPEEQQRLRDFHESLTLAPDGEQLFGVLHRYCEWLKTLTSAERAELTSLAPDSRVARIRELMKEQEKQRVRRLANLSYEEGQTVLAWLDQLIEPREAELMAAISVPAQEYLRRKDDPRDRRRILMGTLFREGKGDTLREAIQPTRTQLDNLLTGLTDQTRLAFQKLNDQEQQEDLLRKWVWGVVVSPFYIPINEAELHKVYANLPQETQTQLERLPREEMQQELRRMYFLSRFGRPDGKWGDGRPRLGAPPFRGSYSNDRDRRDGNQLHSKESSQERESDQ
jgi:hypothetical protein